MQQSFYYGQIGQKDSERLLGTFGVDGSFLLRDSQSEHGALCLCVRKAPYVHTYRIVHSHQGWVLETENKEKLKWFQSLDKLIESYKETPHNMVPLLYPLEKSHLNEEERQIRGNVQLKVFSLLLDSGNSNKKGVQTVCWIQECFLGYY